jgi:hypothetical protein
MEPLQLDLSNVVADGSISRAISRQAASAGSRLPAPGASEKRLLGVERICLDQHATQIQLNKQLLLLRRSLLETARSWFSTVT